MMAFLHYLLMSTAIIMVLYGLFQMFKYPRVLLDLIRGPFGVIVASMIALVGLPVMLAYAVMYPSIFMACFVLFLTGAAVRWGTTQET